MEVESNTRETIKKIENWGRRWRVVFSPNKSGYIKINGRGSVNSFSLEGKEIEEKEDIKILGVYVAKNLKWKKQVENIKRKGTKLINTMKLLVSNKVGIGMVALVQIIKQIMIKQIDYGRIMMVEETKKEKNELKVMENNAIRMVMGVPKFAATEVIRKETGIPDPERRRKNLVLKYMLKKAVKDQGKYVTRVKKDLDKYRRNGGREWKELLEEICSCMEREKISMCVNKKEEKKRPWEEGKVEFLTDELEFQRSCRKEEVAILFENYKKEQSKDWIWWGIDGSVRDKRKGFGVFCQEKNIERSIQVPEIGSIFTAELAGIWYTSNMLCEKEEKNIILSDSKSVILAIKQCTDKGEDCILEVKNRMEELAGKGKVRVIWTPGHSNISENEKADRLAKNATSGGKKPMISIILKGDIKRFCKKKIEMEMEETMRDVEKFRHIKFNNITDYSFIKNRRDAVDMARIRTNSWITKGRVAMIVKNNENLCNVCKEREDLEHLLMKCVKTKEEREEWIKSEGRNPVNWSDILNWNSNKDKGRKIKAILKIIKKIPRHKLEKSQPSGRWKVWGLQQR